MFQALYLYLVGKALALGAWEERGRGVTRVLLTFRSSSTLTEGPQTTNCSHPQSIDWTLVTNG